MTRRLPVGRICGVEIRVDWTWIVTFVVASWTFSVLDRALLPDLILPRRVLLAVLTAAGLFASLGAHELVRVFAFRGCGVPVRRLTLFVLGGVSDAERDRTSPGAELVGAIAAPAASVAIAVVVALGIAIADAPMPLAIDDLDRLGAPGVALLELALANVVIAALNLLPAFPLDGGRILRAAIWKATGDIDRATRLAAWSGQIVGWMLVVAGLAISLSATGLLVVLGMWIAFAGWFIASAAAQGYAGVISSRTLS